MSRGGGAGTSYLVEEDQKLPGPGSAVRIGGKELTAVARRAWKQAAELLFQLQVGLGRIVVSEIVVPTT